MSLYPTFSRAKAPGNALSWGWLEIFVLIQFLTPALLFLPGAQSLRFVTRALPYLSSIGLLVLLLIQQHNARRIEAIDAPAPRPFLPPGGKWLIAAWLVLVLSLFHPASRLTSGLAQCLLQLAIAAPCFWAVKLMDDERRLDRLMWLVLICNGLSALVGALQVYYPDQFMPPEFSRQGLAMNPYFVESLTYEGADGQRIVRPPGLSDLPGGASTAGMIIGIIGTVLSIRVSLNWIQRGICLGFAVVGMFVLYLTQVRSLLVVMIAAILISGLILWRRGQLKQTGLLIVYGVGLVVASFMWAVNIGGRAISERFLGIAETGLVESYQKYRGHFLEYTLEELLFDYPLGAGVGRWGMMEVYFPDTTALVAKPVHVEIQVTGWLIDGGWPLLLCYLVALGTSLFHTYKLTQNARTADMAYFACITLCMNLGVVAQSFAGPTFNTQLGIQYWLLYAVLVGAGRVAEGAVTGAAGPGGGEAPPRRNWHKPSNLRYKPSGWEPRLRPKRKPKT